MNVFGKRGESASMGDQLGGEEGRRGKRGVNKYLTSLRSKTFMEQSALGMYVPSTRTQSVRIRCALRNRGIVAPWLFCNFVSNR